MEPIGNDTTVRKKDDKNCRFSSGWEELITVSAKLLCRWLLRETDFLFNTEKETVLSFLS